MHRRYDRSLRMARAAARPPSWTSEEIAKIRKLIRGGGTTHDVWRAFAPHLSYSAVRSRLARLGIKPIHGRAHRGFVTTLPGCNEEAA